MKTKIFAQTLFALALLLGICLSQPADAAYQSPEAAKFMDGFSSFKQKDYSAAVQKFNALMGQPDSQLRELSLVFLARSWFKSGNTNEAAYALFLLDQEFPDSPLKNSLEQDLIRAVKNIDPKTLITLRNQKEQERIAREKAEAERLAAIKAEEERRAREKAEAERIAREKKAAELLANHKAFLFRAAAAPDLLFTLPAEAVVTAGQQTRLPITLRNPGTLADRFAVAVNLPANWKAGLSMDGAPVSITPEIPPGGSVALALLFTPPATVIDGQLLPVPLAFTSQLVKERPFTGEFRMTASAPIVRALVKKHDTVEGNVSRAQCLISVLNVGSTAADRLSVTIVHSPAYVPQTGAATGITPGTAPDSVQLGLGKLGSGELQEYLIEFKLKDKTRPQGGIACQATIVLE